MYLPWSNPLGLKLSQTADSMSFATMPAGYTGLPVGEHVGAFAVRRRHHIHEGVDLYCNHGAPVFAVEDGVVLAVKRFTGPEAGHTWWLPTDAAFVLGASGVVVYGEIKSAVRAGAVLKAGNRLGSVAQVLKANKGRPTAMLHLELRSDGVDLIDWALDTPKPAKLLDPTPFLRHLAAEG